MFAWLRHASRAFQDPSAIILAYHGSVVQCSAQDMLTCTSLCKLLHHGCCAQVSMGELRMQGQLLKAVQHIDACPYNGNNDICIHELICFARNLDT
jgi:hypothetical protein